MIRKIFKSGNSYVVSLPRESLNLLGLQDGSEVDVAVDEEQAQIIIKKSPAFAVRIDPEFAKQVDEFIEKYRPALEALAK